MFKDEVFFKKALISLSVMTESIVAAQIEYEEDLRLLEYKLVQLSEQLNKLNLEREKIGFFKKLWTSKEFNRLTSSIDTKIFKLMSKTEEIIETFKEISIEVENDLIHFNKYFENCELSEDMNVDASLELIALVDKWYFRNLH